MEPELVNHLYSRGREVAPTLTLEERLIRQGRIQYILHSRSLAGISPTKNSQSIQVYVLQFHKMTAYDKVLYGAPYQRPWRDLVGLHLLVLHYLKQ